MWNARARQPESGNTGGTSPPFLLRGGFRLKPFQTPRFRLISLRRTSLRVLQYIPTHVKNAVSRVMGIYALAFQAVLGA